MAVTYVGVSTAEQPTDSNSITVAKPAGVVQNNVLFAAWGLNGDLSPVTPAGWTKLFEDVVMADSRRVAVYYKVAGASEPSSYTFTTAAAGRTNIALIAFAGNATANPIDVWASAGSGGFATAPSVNASKATRLLTIHARLNNSDPQEPPVGLTERASLRSQGNYPTVWVGEKALTASGATGTQALGPDSFGDTSTNLSIVIAENVPPNAPTLTSPVGASVLDRTSPQRFTFTGSDPDAGDTQSRYDLRYKLTSSATWTVITGITPNSYHDFPAGTFAAGDYEWQARTYDAQGNVGPYSGSEFFTAATPPTGPTITSPTSGQTIATATAPVTWSYPTEQAYQVRTVADAGGSPNTAVVYTDTGVVEDSTARSRTVAFATNGRYEHMQVRVRDAGLWSPWASVRVLVSYTPPAVPTVVLTADDAAGSITVALNVGVWPVDVSAVTFTGTGTGTMTGPAATAGVTGTYNWTATLTTAAVDGGTFTVAKDGVNVGTVAVGAQFSHEGLTFTINDGATDFALNDRFAWSTTAVKTVGHDVWRRAGASGDGIRIAKDITPGSGWTDYTPASGVDYQYKAVSLGDNGATAESSWTA